MSIVHSGQHSEFFSRQVKQKILFNNFIIIIKVHRNKYFIRHIFPGSNYVCVCGGGGDDFATNCFNELSQDISLIYLYIYTIIFVHFITVLKNNTVSPQYFA